MIRKAILFLTDVRNELNQVSWSTQRELWGSTKVVLVTVALLSAVVGIFDFICAQLVSWMVR